MKHHSSCCHPPAMEGVLLPRIISHERLHPAPVCTALRLCTVPECGRWRLVSLHACGPQPKWECTDGRLYVTIPVCAQLCDECGRQSTASGEIRVESCIPRACMERPCHALFIQPQVQLLCAQSTCDRSVFDVQACVTLDLYLLKLEPCMHQSCRPACPQLPLYPPPMH